MGKIMDFIKGTNQESPNSTSGYTLYDSYSTAHRARTYLIALKRAGKQTKLIETDKDWQLWYKD